MTAGTGTRPVREELFSIDPPALVVGRCDSCGSLHFPRRALCPECQSPDIRLDSMSGEGTIYTLTVVRMTPPGYVGEAPYAIGVVELAEPLRVAATLLADDLERLAIGDPVQFELIEIGVEDPVLTYGYRQVTT
jgi:uncharacterized OB-fold protein